MNDDPTAKIITIRKPHAGVGCKRCGCRWAEIGYNGLCGRCHEIVANPVKPLSGECVSCP